MEGHYHRWRICHEAGDKQTCCRGFWNTHADRITAPDVQTARRLNLVEEV